MNVLPKARTKNIVVQNLRDEVLIYDTITNQAFCLNETSANIFNHCNGATSFDEFKRRYKYTNDLIFLALDELKEKNLLDSAANYQTPFAGMNRREVIRKVGLASMVALPVVAGIIAPTALNAASGNNRALQQVCTANSQCTSNTCVVTNGGTRRCCASTLTNQAQEPGTNLGGTSNATCTNIIGPQYCCSGTATNTPGVGCICN